MKNLTADEKRKRIDEVHKKGVYFHTFSTTSKMQTREAADKMIEDNIDALIGAKKVLSPKEAANHFRELFKR